MKSCTAQAVGEYVQVRAAVRVALDPDVELAVVGQTGHAQWDVAGHLHHLDGAEVVGQVERWVIDPQRQPLPKRGA